MKTIHKSLANLKIGESAIISGFSDDIAALKLLEMGCLPGEEVTLTRVAPSGDPVCITLDGGELAVGKAEAGSVLLHEE